MDIEAAVDPALSRQIAEARLAGHRALRCEPRATSAAYDVATSEVRVQLHNGASFAIPVRMLDELVGARDEDLAGVRVPPSGFGIEWPALDVHISLAGVLEAAFGSVVRSGIARKAGSTRSSAKTRAARENGKKGGRPRKAKSE